MACGGHRGAPLARFASDAQQAGSPCGPGLGMFVQRPQNTNVIYAISDEPMSAEEWKKQYVTNR
jgi:hypothetical protein